MLYIKTEKATRVLQRLERELSPDQLKQAQVRAINDALSKGRTIARKEVKKVYNISQKDLGGINFYKANKNTLTGKLYASRKPIPLDAFSPKFETQSKGISITKRGQQKIKEFRRVKKSPTGGVSIEVERGHREIIPYAFMIPGGAVRVFARGQYRTGGEFGFIQRHQRVSNMGSDIPVKPLISLSVFGTVINGKVIKQIARQVENKYDQRMVHHINFLADKAIEAAKL